MSFSVQGAWTRQSVSVDGSDAFETQHVYWLQAGPCYADIRVPFHPAGAFRCFAGRSYWDGGEFRWTHRLDLEQSHPEDVGHLFWEGGRLIERGWFGEVTYEEVWLRIDDEKGPFLAAEGPNGCLVRVGDHAVTVIDRRGSSPKESFSSKHRVRAPSFDKNDARGIPEGSFGACYRVLARDGWETRAAIGDAAPLPSPAAIPAEWLPVELVG